MIRIIIKLLQRAIIILAIVFAVVYLFLLFKGRTIFVRELRQLTQREVSVGYFSITLPLNINVRNLDIKGLLKVDSATISPSFIGLLTGRLVLTNVRLVKPEFTYEKMAPQAAGLTSTGKSVSTPTPAVAAKTEEKPVFPVILKRLSIKDGRINFIDHTVGTGGIMITLREINFSLRNIYAFPASIITNFELSGKIPWKEGQDEGKIEARGWVDLIRRDMQATFKIEDIDGVYLYPYYSTWVDLEKVRIEKAKLNFSSNVKGVNNNITAECHLELTDIVRRQRPEGEEENKAEKVAAVVLEMFRALNQGKIILDFTIRTKMDRPELGFGNIKMAFETKIAKAKSTVGFGAKDILMLPSKMFEGAVKKTTDISRAVAEGTVALGRELKSAIAAAFKKNK